MPTKGVSDRLRSCRFVVSSIYENKARVAERFQALAVPGVGDGAAEAVLPAPDVEALLTFLAAVLERLGEEMVAADQAYLEEISDDPKFREAREEARDALTDKFLRQRDIFTGTYGKVVAREVGFEANVERDAGRLVLQVQRIVDTLTSGYRPPPEEVAGVTIELETFAGDFDPEYTNLSQAQDDLLRELREADTKLIAKRAAIERFEAWFLVTTRTGVAYYTLVDMDEEARRIRPSLRRPGRREEEDEGEEPPDDAPPDDEPAPSTGSPSTDPPSAASPPADPPSGDPASTSSGEGSGEPEPTP